MDSRRDHKFNRVQELANRNESGLAAHDPENFRWMGQSGFDEWAQGGMKSGFRPGEVLTLGPSVSQVYSD